MIYSYYDDQESRQRRPGGGGGGGGRGNVSKDREYLFAEVPMPSRDISTLLISCTYHLLNINTAKASPGFQLLV